MQFRVHRYIWDKFIQPQNFCCAIFSAIAFTGRLNIDCWFILVVIISIFDIGYRATEVGIHKGVYNDLWKNCIGIKLMKRTCTEMI